MFSSTVGIKSGIDVCQVVPVCQARCPADAL